MSRADGERTVRVCRFLQNGGGCRGNSFSPYHFISFWLSGVLTKFFLALVSYKQTEPKD